MNQSANITPEQEELFSLTKKVHAEALRVLSDTLSAHATETGQAPTNAMQFSAIDGFMAATGQILAAMTVDTIQGSGMKEEEVIQGSVGALFMFQKTIENIFADTLAKANMEGVDIHAAIEKFEEDYKVAKAKGS